ncbi:MAG: hypothetical protein J0L92_30395 [Deltaproteobacteria bacterium]|nr:hypothetical protein [Deltaproteobacteria bacterium]
MTSSSTVRTRLALLVAIAAAPAAIGCNCGNGVDVPDSGGDIEDSPRVPRDVYADDTNEVTTDAGRVARDPERCRVEDGDIYLLGTDTDLAASSRVIDVAAATDEFAAVWREQIEGFPQVRVARIPSTAGEPTALTVTEGLDLHDEPAIATVNGDYLVAWIDNADDDYEVRARALVDGTLGAATRVTTRVGRDDSPSLVTVGENVIASWVENREGDTVRVPITQLLTATGTLSGSNHEITAPANIGRPSLAPREGGAVLLYSEGGADLPDVSLQRLDATGAPVGDPEVMSTEHNAGGDVDVGLTPADGAAVFTALIAGVRRDVRVRLLDGTGEPAMSEFALNEGMEQGDSASVARLRQAVGWSEGCRDGYAVVYRSYPDGGTDTRLRLILLDAGADVVRAIDLDIPNVSNRGGRTTVRIAGDGQLLVAWTDTRADRVDMRAARIRCD